MADKVGAMPDDEFIRFWNASGSLDEATARVQAVVGTPCPRCAVLARAVALRRGGADMKVHRAGVKAAG